MFPIDLRPLPKKAMEEKKWITTEQMLEELKNDPDNEHVYNLSLVVGLLSSTHWFVYDSEKHLFGHTTAWPYDWLSEAKILEHYSGCMWRRNA